MYFNRSFLLLRYIVLVLLLVVTFCARCIPARGAAALLGKETILAFASKSNDGTKSPIPPPPPISMPVWSLASPSRLVDTATTTSSSSSATTAASMNIITFATPVSVAPPKLWAVSLYYNTLTKDSFCESKRAVLQLLKPRHKHLVPVLGKRSGYEEGYSKYNECLELGFPWTNPSGFGAESLFNGLPLLPDCSLYIQLELQSLQEAGDHVVALCRVVGTGVWDASSESVVPLQQDDSSGQQQEPLALDPSSALYTAQLRAEGII